MCISIPFYFKYLTGELFVRRWVDGAVVNANYREWPQIVLEMVCHKYLIVFCWAVILLTRSSIFCIVLLPRRGFSCITAARNAV